MLGKLLAQLLSKIFNLCGHDPPTLQTDGQTTCDSNTALCTIVHRAVKTANYAVNYCISCKYYRRLKKRQAYRSVFVLRWWRAVVFVRDVNVGQVMEVTVNDRPPLLRRRLTCIEPNR